MTIIAAVPSRTVLSAKRWRRRDLCKTAQGQTATTGTAVGGGQQALVLNRCNNRSLGRDGDGGFFFFLSDDGGIEKNKKDRRFLFRSGLHFLGAPRGFSVLLDEEVFVFSAFFDFAGNSADEFRKKLVAENWTFVLCTAD